MPFHKKSITMEIPLSNLFYGHSHIIKEYCNYPKHEPLPVVVQHGVSHIWHSIIHEVYHEVLSDYWVNNQYVSDYIQNEYGVGKGQIHILGSPFAYLVKHLNIDTSFNVDNKGTIAFPDHSIPASVIVGEYEDYAEKLLLLPDEFHPITVSVHPHDIDLNHQNAFLKRGFSVITCGNASPLQCNFLHNLIHFCKGNKYITSNKIQTSSYYGMHLGLKFFIYGDEFQFDIKTDKEDHTYSDEYISEHEKIRIKYNLDTIHTYLNNNSQQEFANKYLGSKHLMDPESLKSYLLDLLNSRKYITQIKPYFKQINQNHIKLSKASPPMSPLNPNKKFHKSQLNSISSEIPSIKEKVNILDKIKAFVASCLKLIKINRRRTPSHHRQRGKQDNGE